MAKGTYPYCAMPAVKVTVDPSKDLYWDYTKAYDKRLEDYYQVTLSASYKINTPKATHEIYLDLQNITNYQARIAEYYDAGKPDKVGYLRAMTAFPQLSIPGIFLKKK